MANQKLLVQTIEAKIRLAEGNLKVFAANLKEDPYETLTWAGAAFLDAARVTVWRGFLLNAESEVFTPQLWNQHLENRRADVIARAQRNTSTGSLPAGNLMAASHTQALAEAIVILSQPAFKVE